MEEAADNTEPAGLWKPRAREFRSLDLDQTNLTFIYVNDCSVTCHYSRGCCNRGILPLRNRNEHDG